MQIAKLPSDEELRLQDLFSYDILDTESEKEFNELVELAGQICNCPVSMITFIDQDRQWFKARLDQGPRETSRDIALCAHAILNKETTIVEDTLLDDRFVNNPLVTNDVKPIRFYAGAPIVSPGGYNVGTICVINNEPQTLTPQQERALEILSAQVTRLLELRVNNKHIRSRAQQLIDLKDRSVHKAMGDYEVQKQQIALTLHEQIAQETAACRLYLRMAEESSEMRVSYIQKANNYLEAVVNDLRELSNSISPSVLYSIPLEDLLFDYVQNIKTGLPFTVSLHITGSNSDVPVEKTILLFRIVERWMKILQERKGVKTLVLHLTLANTIQLSFEDDGEVLGFHAVEQDIISAQIDTSVNSIEGIIKTKTGTSTGNILSIEIPV